MMMSDDDTVDSIEEDRKIRWKEPFSPAANIDDGDGKKSKESSESPNHPQDDGTNEEDGEAMPPTLQTFLSHFGVLTSNASVPHGEGNEHQDGAATDDVLPAHSWKNIIFESSFDLTEDRLRYVFDLLDTDRNGRISYESLRRGLEMHSSTSHATATSSIPNTDEDDDDDDDGTSEDEQSQAEELSVPPSHHPLHLSEESFDRLVELLDVDKSQDITFEEFSQGLRYLMLRALFPQPPPEAQSEGTTSREMGMSNRVQATIEVLDYDAQHLERRLVVHDDRIAPKTTSTNKGKQPTSPNGQLVTASTRRNAASRRSTHRSISHYAFSRVRHMSTSTFYFQERPSWVQTRWINVSGAKSAVTLKRLAVRHMLHPLALEDALTPERHRPKAEVYSNHYFIMIPIFCIDPPTHNNDLYEGEAGRRGPKTLFGFLRKKWRACIGRRNKNKKKLNRASRSIEENETDDDSDEEDSLSPPKIGRIRVQMTSIFVNVPKNDTMITYNSELHHPMGYRASLEELSTPNEETPGSTEPIRSSEPAAVARPPELTTQPQDQHCWTRIYQELSKSYSKLRQYDAQYLTYALLDQAVDLLEPLLHAMRQELSRQDKRLQATNYQASAALQRVRHLQTELEKVARKLKPFIRLMVHVIEDEAISPGATVYLRDVLDNLECHEEEVRQLIRDCQAMDAQADKHQSRQMDRTLYTLTVISAVFLPAQFLTGVWGMNFEYMPELDETWGYKMFWGIATTVILTQVIALNFGRI